jgi:hypothetical protein
MTEQKRTVWIVSAGDRPWNHHSPAAVFDNLADAESQAERLRHEEIPGCDGQKWSVEIDEFVINRTCEQGISKA